jgi:O-antigen/teichoic acid export membrane protein
MSVYSLYYPTIRDEGPVKLTTWCALIITTSFVALVVLLVGLKFPTGLFRWPNVGLVAVGGWMMSLTLFCQRVLQGRSSASIYLRISLGISAVMIAAALVSQLVDKISWFFGIWILGLASVCGYSVILLLVYLGIPAKGALSRGSVLALLGATFPTALAISSQMVVWRSDTVILGLTASSSDVGLYSLAAAATSIAWLPSEAIALRHTRRFVVLSTEPDVLMNELRLNCKLAAAATVVGLALAFVVLHFVTERVLFDFAGSLRILAILSIGAVFAAVGRVLLSHAGLVGRNGPQLRFSFVSGLALAAYVPAGLVGGATGIAWVSAGAYTCSTIPLLSVLRTSSSSGSELT